MKDYYHFTILGCGASLGVPRITGDWGACDPTNPKNRRTRSSLKISRVSERGSNTTVIVDTGPDFYMQVLREQVLSIDAVLYTHPHADHIHGIDGLRGYFLKQKRPIDVYAAPDCMKHLFESFRYCFKALDDRTYPPIVNPIVIENNDVPICMKSAGGVIEAIPILQQHGRISSLGFRFGNVAYCTDVNAFPAESLEKLQNLDFLIIDALKNGLHSSHFSLSESLKKIELINPKNAILTHMHVDLDYDMVLKSTPSRVVPAFDGMQFSSPIP
ncbi:MBL fold metallo-hydrolase [Candidatus Liberibacter asiaticus]|uniref:Metal-dependent hydrolase protein n=2 Tax=Liberibacter asiaticus TaxID=34021 RepID=C6XHE4_LIBAP|nr:MBL fold metallo-hydrolase [Candidatus Liberibacter asiaticus]ACT56687.1 metal-dependent hydrolase protein [Candidatus Liberibacter asiaticus str. psy62]AGH16455.1 metal-dependent hydrolase protein [Candidatus Liberibacter asiaticus str. gxpsy]ALK06862.1 MBL fold metallo-hydrolase [Candidatus Liberibacter asiaticus]ASK52331.1 phosphoribosyl 1,2-cyclic phosphodiesterase [Candidatus Liberibacter asiaticus]AWL13653.1 MBL fold metallo-hydrolase [Candidatus Liberibacter asiaticus]